jgi:antitoxin component of RelBE/YafQ-DinJ toxin-antitoxin module
MSDTGFRIRVNDELRRDFIQTCKSEDMTASQVLRAYMRFYVESHRPPFNKGDANRDTYEQRLSLLTLESADCSDV